MRGDQLGASTKAQLPRDQAGAPRDHPREGGAESQVAARVSPHPSHAAVLTLELGMWLCLQTGPLRRREPKMRPEGGLPPKTGLGARYGAAAEGVLGKCQAMLDPWHWQEREEEEEEEVKEEEEEEEEEQRSTGLGVHAGRCRESVWKPRGEDPGETNLHG